MLAHLRNRLKDVDHRKDGDEHHKKLAELGDELELALIEAERDLVNKLYRGGELKDEGRRRIERELDLRDTLLANLRSSGMRSRAPRNAVNFTMTDCRVVSKGESNSQYSFGACRGLPFGRR